MSEQNETDWKFDEGDVVEPLTGGTSWEILRKLTDANSGERFYRIQVSGRDFDDPPKGFNRAEDLESEYEK